MLYSIYVEHKISHIVMVKVKGVVLGELTNAVFLTKPMRILSGIGPRNTLSIEICWEPELTVKVLI